MLKIRVNPNWSVWYKTTYFINGEKYVYVTKTHTDYHRKIHMRADYAETLMMDKTVDWPFGLYTEIIQQTQKN